MVETGRAFIHDLRCSKDTVGREAGSCGTEEPTEAAPYNGEASTYQARLGSEVEVSCR
jgi:hypothetical protein